MSYLYVFVDESGNLDFSVKGTKYFVMAAIAAKKPVDSSNVLQKLKYNFLASGGGGDEFQNFHASEDKQIVRNAVFEKINKLENIKVNFIYAEKRKTHPKYQNDSFYALLGAALVKYLLKIYSDSQYEKIIIVFDQALTKKERNNFLKAVKPELKKIGTPYAIYFHRTMSDFNGQIADYCAWAKYVSLEKDESRPLHQINDIHVDSFDIFSSGNTNYY